LVNDYEAPLAIPRTNDSFFAESPIDVDLSDQPRVKVKTLVNDVAFLEKMDAFIREVTEA